jgi:hypothetical protein
MKYHKPYLTEITTEAYCDYGCENKAKYQFRSGKYCCSAHYNSCPGKRKHFSETQNHSENSRKSLETRTKLGITKSSQVKAGKTRRENGHYERLAERMKEIWAERPWDNNPHCPYIPYKNTTIIYQGSHELQFLEGLEETYGIDWLVNNVRRGPAIKYFDENEEERLYISDYIIGNTIYEIKSLYYWQQSEERNKKKMKACLDQGFHVILVLNGEHIDYGSIGTLG